MRQCDCLGRIRLLAALPVELVDTAGERALPTASGGAAADDADPGAVERAGQDLARWLRTTADVVLVVSPVGEPPPALPATDAPTALVMTMADRSPGGAPPGAVCARVDPAGAARCVARIVHALLDLGAPRDWPGRAWVPGRGVPFRADLAEGIAAAFALPPGPRRDAALDACLDSRPAPGPRV
jgi:hypothetical protein